MDDWKRLISRGNLCFERGELGVARALYQDALYLADRRLMSWPDADAAVAALVVAHHNLAELHTRLDQLTDAADHLQAAHARLMRLLVDPGAPGALQQAALRHSTRTRAEHLSFTGLHADAAKPLRWVPERADATDAAVISLVH